MKLATYLPFALLLTASASAQTTWYVDVNGTPPGSGTLADPYTSIQHAIAQPATEGGDTILVAPGTYAESLDLLGKAITVRGTAGASATIVDAGGSGSVATFVNGEPSVTVLEGLTLTGGEGTGTFPFTSGGGIYCVGSSPSLVDLVVRNNIATTAPGVYLESSFARFDGCVIDDNEYPPYLLSPPGDGGGILATADSLPFVLDCEITRNVAFQNGGGVSGPGLYVSSTITGNVAYRGGGVYLSESPGAGVLELYDCSIGNNTSGSSLTGECAAGGGIFGPAFLSRCDIFGNWSCSIGGGGAYRAVLAECTIRNNRATSGLNSTAGGGVLECELTNCILTGNTNGTEVGPPFSRGGGAADSVLVRCTLSGNTTYGRGGGADGCTLTECIVFDNEAIDLTGLGGGLSNCVAWSCVIYGNSAINGGGFAGGTCTQCTIYGNTAQVTGGGVGDSPSGTMLDSCIVSNNVPQEILGSVLVTYSDVLGGWPGVGNSGENPQLWNPAAGDFHLMAGSPCIDTGSPALPLDADGSRADMGAIPFDSAYSPSRPPGIAFCFGVGCPCANDDPAAGCYNSTGSGAALSGSGSVSVALDDLTLTATGCPPGNSGLFFGGNTRLLPPPMVGDGLGCVGGSSFRYFPGVVDLSGTFVKTHLVGTAPPGFITPGSTRHFQAWTRDVLCGPPPIPCPSPCGNNNNLTNAYTVTFAP